MAKKGLEGEYKQLIFDVIEKGEPVEGLKARDDMGKVTVHTYVYTHTHQISDLLAPSCLCSRPALIGTL